MHDVRTVLTGPGRTTVVQYREKRDVPRPAFVTVTKFVSLTIYRFANNKTQLTNRWEIVSVTKIVSLTKYRYCNEKTRP